MSLKRIQIVDSCELPAEVEEYLEERDIWTHDIHNMMWVHKNDDDPFANWVKERGLQFEGKDEVRLILEGS